VLKKVQETVAPYLTFTLLMHEPLRFVAFYLLLVFHSLFRRYLLLQTLLSYFLSSTSSNRCRFLKHILHPFLHNHPNTLWITPRLPLQSSSNSSHHLHRITRPLYGTDIVCPWPQHHSFPRAHLWP
jgi:hypothetical protein